jgi:hypothetical protein
VIRQLPKFARRNTVVTLLFHRQIVIANPRGFATA